MTSYALGRRPADPDRPLLRLADVLTGAVPAHGVTADHFSKVGDWGLQAGTLGARVITDE